MNGNPYVVFTQRAFNAIITETIEKHPIETGGIFIGYILDNGVWVVVETIPPGYRTIHQRAYFEYDAEFVNYLSNTIALQYKGNLQVLGLWHRHPGCMDAFSTTDDETNLKFAKDRECGSISALVNCDPQMRLTMYHVDQHGRYQLMEWYVDDGEIIPEEFLELRYVNPESLPRFDSRGIIPDDAGRSVSNDEEEISEPERDINSVDQGAVESMESYTLTNAWRDFRVIIKKLLK